MVTAIASAHRPDLLYADNEGQPMPDITLQFKWIGTIKEGLEAMYRNDEEVFVARDLLWYPEEGKPKVRPSPTSWSPSDVPRLIVALTCSGKKAAWRRR